MSLLKPLRPLPHPEHWRTWVPIVATFKILLFGTFFLVGHFTNGGAGLFSLIAGDTFGYFDPIESVLSGNGYQPDLRMPGYGAVYLLARLMARLPSAYDLIVVLQCALAAVSMYRLALMAFRLSGSQRVFLLTLLIYGVSLSVQWYDVSLITESFCTSALILFADRLIVWHDDRKPRNLLFAGLWITWAIFLKPVMLPVLAIALTGFWLAERRTGPFVRASGFFLLPFLLVDGVWILRNEALHGTFSPLTRTIYLDAENPHPKLRSYEFVSAFGGDIVWWGDPHAEIRFFNVGEDQLPGHTNAGEIHLPDRILTSAYSMDSLHALSDGILALKDPTMDGEERTRRTREIMGKLELYRATFIKEHPVQYHVLARALPLVRYWYQTGIPFLPDRPLNGLSRIRQAMMIVFRTLHTVTLLGGLIGGVLWWRAAPDRSRIITPLLLVPYGLLVFPLLLRFSEHRYLVPFTPFLLLACTIGIHTGAQTLRSR